MSTYLYYECCGYESEPFQFPNDRAAEAYVLATFRSPNNPDFDGDEGGIVRVEHDENGDEYREGVISFDGENMIPDPFNQRRSYRGGI